MARIAPHVCVALVACGLCGGVVSAQADGRELYLNACAACHGADGTGLPRSVLGFETPVPDFTDCSFATPEADPDWMAVVHDGGPVRAFDRRMPVFGEALREIEIQRILDYIRTFCGDPRWPRGELNLPRALVTEKAFPENETVLTTTVAARVAARVANELLYERRIGARAQVEVVVPFVAHETGSRWRSGLGDVGVAIKRVVFHSLEAGSILSAAAEAAFPTGKETQGLGKDVTVFEPFLAFGQILPADGFLQVQAGAELHGLLPWAAPVAAAPGLAAAVCLAVFPPAPTRLRVVGWTLVSVSAVAALILIGAVPAAG